ncbi:hypothetical protein GCM10010488_39170 [Oerskovia jenensis]
MRREVVTRGNLPGGTDEREGRAAVGPLTPRTGRRTVEGPETSPAQPTDAAPARSPDDGDRVRGGENT